MDMEPEPETRRGVPRPSLARQACDDSQLPTKQQALALVLRAGGATFEDVGIELGVKASAAARLVQMGMQVLRVRSQAELIAALGGRAEPGPLPALLTPAEREVVTLLLSGRSNREIGLERRTSTRTVANQLQAIYNKLGAGSRRELVALLLNSPARKS